MGGYRGRLNNKLIIHPVSSDILMIYYDGIITVGLNLIENL